MKRTYGKASLQLVEPQSLPEPMRDKVWELNSLKSENPGKGEATWLIQSVCREANRAKKVLMLMADEGLIPFYERFGFYKAQDNPPLMLRTPL